MLTTTRILIAIALTTLTVGSAEAGIISLTNGSATWSQLTGPVNLSINSTESDTQIYIFEERSSLTLGSNLTVDTTSNGTFTSDPGSGTITSGTLIDSFIIHMDTVEGGGSPVTHTGLTVTFDAPILGIIGSNGLLNSSDSILGDPLSTYTPTNGRQTWEGFDSISVSGNTLTINSMRVADTFNDQVRVVVAAVPEPSTFALLAVGGLVAAVYSRRRLRGQQVVV